MKETKYKTIYDPITNQWGHWVTLPDGRKVFIAD